LAAVIIVGPRIGRFSDDKSPLRGSNYPVATVGVLVLWFGWFGFNGGGTYAFDESVPLILVNTSLAAAAGGFSLLSWAWLRDKKPDIAASLNGTIAGLVGVTAGANLFETTDAVLVGVICAFACGMATKLLERFRIDDVISAWPAHAIAGGAGTLLVAVLGDVQGFPMEHSRLEQFAVQAMGVIVVAIWAFGGGFAVLFVLNKLLPLRVSEADERIGLNISEHDASTDLIELMSEMDAQRREGDFEMPVTVEPHTEVGQIAAEYNRVLERVRLEIETREEAYRQLEEATEFRFIFENAHEGIVQFARNGKINKANPAAVSLLGFTSEDELVRRGGNWLTNLDGIDREEHIKMLRILKSRSIARDVEMNFTRRIDGREAQLQLDLRSVSGHDGGETTVLGSLIDISERKANDRLRIERDSATAASQAKSEFLANMSHEIRTPLNGVTGMLELLGRTELDTRQARFVDIAGTSADALLSVINDILDVSKIEAGKFELESTAFNLPELLADVVDMFAPQASSKNIELASLVPTNLPNRVLGDPERFRQVLVNLLGNALKFTDEGTVTLRCRATDIRKSDVDIRIDVEDSGQGIDNNQLGVLFDPFTQADGSATRKHGGTGLGLTITKQLVELMNGSISVESVLGLGTTFHIDLTLPMADTVEPPARTLVSAAGTASPHKVRVLAVDDHPINLELLDGLLENEGFEVTAVDGALPALAELESAANEGRPYSLALLDYQMPQIDGGELARRIRADEKFDELRLVILTSIDQALTNAERNELSIHASITKPLRRSRLFDAIDEALGLSPGDRAPATVSALTDLAAEKIASATGTESTEILTGDNSAAPLRESGPAIADSTGKSELTALIVEDNLVNQMVLQELMLAAGHKTKVADDGEQALNQISEGGVDFVLMDCQMPVMDGFEATIRIRQREEEEGLPRLPIIAVTANAIKGDRERCLEAGMDDYVTKPIDAKRLEAAIDKYVLAGE
jgi:Amt family ammonium transporter